MPSLAPDEPSNPLQFMLVSLRANPIANNASLHQVFLFDFSRISFIDHCHLRRIGKSVVMSQPSNDAEVSLATSNAGSRGIDLYNSCVSATVLDELD